MKEVVDSCFILEEENILNGKPVRSLGILTKSPLKKFNNEFSMSINPPGPFNFKADMAPSSKPP